MLGSGHGGVLQGGTWGFSANVGALFFQALAADIGREDMPMTGSQEPTSNLLGE